MYVYKYGREEHCTVMIKAEKKLGKKLKRELKECHTLNWNNEFSEENIKSRKE